MKSFSIEPNDSGWEFDPENPPEEFTVEMLRDMAVVDLLDLSKPDNGILTEEQQASFDAAYAALNEEMAEKFRPAFEALAASLPKVQPVAIPGYGDAIRKATEGLREQLRASSTLARTRIEHPVALDLEEVFPASRTTNVTPAEIEAEVASSVEHLQALQTIAASVQAQNEAVLRGSIFYIVVGLATTMAGVASVVALDSAGDIWLTLAITTGLAALALAAYFAVPWIQRKRE